ncbi:uncharacterized protein cubi_01699 [Cryptosporidium ubiquitum]|uniref:Uncharacterized protein n=1 Tax=Cryptosporidium ubiquitum TaxID=857276 RepID=A0A1J4MAG8_9CRYT|nr:uncharacterized protein cubi_01699 [Cryptosporidium ubiquitum]OII71224.1 hypothetical protein cubi_01699 [Cryptosporidium ubiquitum]
MSFKYIKINLFIFIVIYLFLFVIDLHQVSLHISISFLQTIPKKNSFPKGSFNYLLPPGTKTPSDSRIQRSSLSYSAGNEKTNSSVRGQRNAVNNQPNYGGTSSRAPSFSLPPPDYDDDSPTSPANTRMNREPSFKAVPPQLLLPEADYHDSDLEEQSSASFEPRDITRRRISRSKNFNACNLLANQAIAVSRRSSSRFGSQEMAFEGEKTKRKINSILRESLSYASQQFSQEVLSTEVPYGLIEKCREEFAESLKLVKHINSEITELKLIQEYLRNCNCGTNNCVKCQDYSNAYTAHKSKLAQLKNLLSSKMEFLYEDCFSGTSNKYESESYASIFSSLYTTLYNEITKKNRYHVKNLLLKCEIVVITDKILEKQRSCRKCKKKHEVCKKHSALLQKLREIESTKSKNNSIIKSSIDIINGRMNSLPTRLINDLFELEEQDEKFLTSQIVVKECMNKLKITSVNMSTLGNINSSSTKTKKSSKKKSSIGRTATRSSSYRPGFVGTIQTGTGTNSSKRTQGGATETTLISPEGFPSKPLNYPYGGISSTINQKPSQKSSVKTTSISRRTSSHISKKTPLIVSGRTSSRISRKTSLSGSEMLASSSSNRNAYQGRQTQYSHPLSRHMKTSPSGPFTGTESGAVRKQPKNVPGILGSPFLDSEDSSKKKTKRY